MTTPTFDALLAELAKRAQTPTDKRLVELFTKYREDLTDLFDGSFPWSSNYFATRYTGTVMDFWGPSFHKAFRQTDVLPNADDDIFVWKAIAGESECFWDAAHEVIKGDFVARPAPPAPKNPAASWPFPARR